jgi:hypothetical protein
MAYSAKARELRRCRAVKANGEPCKGWAMWGHPDGYCGAHAGASRVRYPPGVRGPVAQHARYEPCRCPAYKWPHRPGGGLCRWPDPPEWRCTIPAGTRWWQT